jgi:hypothetical protein
MTDKHVSDKFSGFVILELMGHRRLAGFLTVDPPEMPGLLRIDVPGEDGWSGATQYYSAAAVYAITPTTEAIAAKVARSAQPAPVHPWELRDTAPALAARNDRPARRDLFDDDDGIDDEDER